MHKITLNIKDNAYEKIYNFLQNFSNDVEIVNHNIFDKHKNEEIKNLKGVFNKYANISKLNQEENAWEKHIVNKYKKDNL